MEHRTVLESLDQSAEINGSALPNNVRVIVDPIDPRRNPDAIVERQSCASESRINDDDQTAPKEETKRTRQSTVKMQKSSKLTPKKWTLEHLLHNSNSELTKCASLKATLLRKNTLLSKLTVLLSFPSIQERINFQLLNLLPQDDLDELCKLLPPADINFIKYNEAEEHATEIVAESLEEYETMSTLPDTYFPIISSRFVSPEFIRTVEDFQILLSNGHYELEAPQVEEPKKTAGRKRSNYTEIEEDLFKDEQYEAYWGERLKKSKNKRSRK
ncbi:hypothetical protein BX666DRAFT_1972375 [Dichotomocladium elegans]|nr:hypothetical protein BX666DRAFT_1972375 [Dichotomocladium elegans]